MSSTTMPNEVNTAMNRRASGVLLHITSLPSRFGIGDLGPEAYRFVDFLEYSGQRYWQILPLSPTGTYIGNSPYTAYSVFAGNPILVSPEMLAKDGLLDSRDLQDCPPFSSAKVDYLSVTEYKKELLGIAYSRFQKSDILRNEYDEFVETESDWLEDYSLFVALKQTFEEDSWDEWPEGIRDRTEMELGRWKMELEGLISESNFRQFLFFRQWKLLKEYSGRKGIYVFGDIPIYPSMDSSDAWANSDLFKLDKEKQPLFVAGAPPDYFSATGQRWGNPVYRWDYLKDTGYSWWLQRIQHNLEMFDIVRIDHFRGFVAYWEIPAEEDTATKGEWVDAPAIDFFASVLRNIPDLPLVVEDLGFITDDVRDVMKHFGFPGMKVLQFAFGHDLPTNPYAPHNFEPNCVAYTGTHDNNTVRGWFEKEAGRDTKERLDQYTGKTITAENVSWEFIRLAMGSTANTAIVPMQDVLALGEDARMNLPSLSSGNWTWRLPAGDVSHPAADRLRQMTRLYGR